MPLFGLKIQCLSIIDNTELKKVRSKIIWAYVRRLKKWSLFKTNKDCQLSRQMFVRWISVMEIWKDKNWCFQISKIVSRKIHFGILIYMLSRKDLFGIYFRLLRRNNKLKINTFMKNIWRNNWRFNIRSTKKDSAH